MLPIAAGEEVWCPSWPEPDAGSDLADIRSRAVRNPQGDGWILSGQKTCVQQGAFAQWCFGIFLTDPDAGPHRGLTYFLIAMDRQGSPCDRFVRSDGEAGVAEIFFDDVEVPDLQVLGHEGSGWSIAMSNPGNEHVFGLRGPAAILPKRQPG